MPLSRALSKLGILSRSQATAAILAGRVRVGGRIVRNPLLEVDPDRARISVDDVPQTRAEWRTIVLHKPRGVVVTRSDPRGRRTVYDVLGDAGRGLVPVGRLDLATTGLLLLTTDTQLAEWLTNPANHVRRVYAVSVRGTVTADTAAQLTIGVVDRGERLRASDVTVRKASGRESHLIVELEEGKNREIRRLFKAIGHEVTRLKRVSFGALGLEALEPGEWRELSRDEIARLFPRRETA